METLSSYALVKQANRGVSMLLLDKFLQQSKLSKAELSRLLGIDPKTLDNYRQKNKTLDRLRSELLLKLLSLFELGSEVFGKTDEFQSWLHLPAGEFANAAPIDLLTTVTGAHLVERQVERIAQGYVV